VKLAFLPHKSLIFLNILSRSFSCIHFVVFSSVPWKYGLRQRSHGGVSIELRRTRLRCKNASKINVLFGCRCDFSWCIPLWPLWLCGWGVGWWVGLLGWGPTEYIIYALNILYMLVVRSHHTQKRNESKSRATSWGQLLEPWTCKVNFSLRLTGGGQRATRPEGTFHTDVTQDRKVVPRGCS